MSAFWTDQTVRDALGLESGVADPAFRYSAISTDTRTAPAGSLFVAIRGEHFDGHGYLEAAREAGALGAVVQEGSEVPDGVTPYPVRDTLLALGALAAYRRTRHAARFIGVVGSNGKTTTKELIRTVLGGRFRVHATEGNLNNRIGVPMTLLALPDDAEVAVIEMGTDRPGEISLLGEIVRPDIVVITSIGEEHLELLGDLDGVLEEEVSVLQTLAPQGKAFVVDEPVRLARRARELVGRSRVRIAGMGDGADLRVDGGARGVRVLEDGSTLWVWRGSEVRLPIPGTVNVRNALLALGIAAELGVPGPEAARTLSGVRLPKLRGQWVRVRDVRILADCYNSNPPSLAAAIDLLVSLSARGRKVAVVGTMREMGEAADHLHAIAATRIARLARDQIDLIVATGAFVEAFEPHRRALGDQLISERDPMAAYRRYRGDARPTDTILLKASRGEQLERWVGAIEQESGSRTGSEGGET